MKWKIVVDSSCDLREMQNEDGIAFASVPLKFLVGERSFIDDKEMDVAEFMQVLDDYPGKTSSSAPNAGDWKQEFEEGENIFAITISSNVSGSAASAHAAVQMLKDESKCKNIKVFDTLSTGPEMTLLVQKITEYIHNGLSFEEISEKAEKYLSTTHLLYVLESLDHLIKNGRVSKLEGGIAGFLGIRILGVASREGTLELLDKCRGQKKVYDQMVNRMLEYGFDGGKVIISHCFNEEWATYVKNKIKERFESAKVSIMPTGGLCSYYAQMRGILVGFETKATAELQ